VQNDPFFLQQLEVTESDFQTLKREQALHVDFSVFPQNVLELLNLCCARPDDSPVKCEVFLLSYEFRTSILSLLYFASRHAAELTLGANKLSTLQIFELHHFKNLQHLSLQFREGNDAAVKKYLADRLIDSKSRMRNLEAELSAQCVNSIEQGRELNSAKDEVWKLREQHAVTVGDLKYDLAFGFYSCSISYHLHNFY
jgi:spindle assembly abnormal protein 6